MTPKSNTLLVLRIAGVLFSFALATVYVACQSGYGSKSSKDVNADPGDPPSDPPSSGEGRFFPGSKSAPIYEGDLILQPLEQQPDSKPEPQEPPIFLPGSKSNSGAHYIFITPEQADEFLKEFGIDLASESTPDKTDQQEGKPR